MKKVIVVLQVYTFLNNIIFLSFSVMLSFTQYFQKQRVITFFEELIVSHVFCGSQMHMYSSIIQ